MGRGDDSWGMANGKVQSEGLRGVTKLITLIPQFVKLMLQFYGENFCMSRFLSGERSSPRPPKISHSP